MPGMYDPNEYDLAGFAVGLVEKERIIDGKSVAAGDAVIGLASSGVHSNGYSLVRKILAVSGAQLDEPFAGRTLGAALLEPTRIYVKPVLALIEALPVKGLAHITGGGLVENVPRVLPEAAAAHLEKDHWPRPAIFDWLQAQGNVPESDMHRTFNCGIGMVVVVAREHLAAALAILRGHGEQAWEIGTIRPRAGTAPQAIVA
jgi:phosphoribosylformylglycinamidine cyclo-ligase